jgi:hypothetical protein
MSRITVGSVLLGEKQKPARGAETYGSFVR